MRNNNIAWKKKACSRYYGVSPVSRHLFITKNVKKHEKLQSPLNKWLSQGILSFHLFLDILSYSKVSKNRKTTKSLEFLHLLQFLHNSTKTSAAGARQGTRSVPVISVPSRNEAWEVYPLEMYYPDDPTRLCRPKAGQSLVEKKIGTGRVPGSRQTLIVGDLPEFYQSGGFGLEFEVRRRCSTGPMPL